MTSSRLFRDTAVRRAGAVARPDDALALIAPVTRLAGAAVVVTVLGALAWVVVLVQ
ncbi:MAG: hypothetical protein WCZ23_03160 [Rhodospirillaceae bacterium]